jgi:hypothetical protein
MGPYVKFLQGLEFPEAARENISWKTAAELFKIDVSKVSAAGPPPPR